MQGTLAGGNLSANATLKFNDQLPFQASIQLNGLDANELTKQLGGQQNEFKGTTNITLSLSGKAKSSEELFKSLSGSGSFDSNNGRIATLSILQKKVEEANVLEQGVVGFRVSNVLGIIEPKENGEFLSANGQMNIDNGIVQLKKIVINGEELKLESTGTINLNTKKNRTSHHR